MAILVDFTDFTLWLAWLDGADEGFCICILHHVL